jgi:magnesium chelatase family protein
MVGPPGAGKSMLVARLPGLLPPLDASEILEISMIRSLAGELQSGRLTAERSFRNPHHTASTPALIGGGHRIKPGEVSLSHFGVLFLDELPEFQRGALEALRQPLETGRATIVRANAHVTYPASFQLVAAMNPCRCGHLDNPAEACSRRQNAPTLINRAFPGLCSTASTCISTCPPLTPPISACPRR